MLGPRSSERVAEHGLAYGGPGHMAKGRPRQAPGGEENVARLLLSGVIGIAVWTAIPSASAQAVGRSCPSYSSAVNHYEVRSMGVGGTTCGGGRGVVTNWAQNCSADHCIVGA